MNSKLLKIARYLGQNGLYEEAANLKKLASDMEDQGGEAIPYFENYDMDFAFYPDQKLPEVKRRDGHGNIDFKVYRLGPDGTPLLVNADGSLGNAWTGGQPMMQKYRFQVNQQNPSRVKIDEIYDHPGQKDPTRNHIGDVSKIDAIRIWNEAGWKASAPAGLDWTDRRTF